MSAERQRNEEIAALPGSITRGTVAQALLMWKAIGAKMLLSLADGKNAPRALEDFRSSRTASA
jgi:hypothetical protein